MKIDSITPQVKNIMCNSIQAIVAAILIFGSSQIQAIEDTALSIDEYIILLRKSPIDSAIKDVIEQADKENPTVQANLGIALVKIKYFMGAIDVLTRATKLDQHNVSAYAHLGYANYEMQDCERALPALHKAIELDSGNSNAWVWHEYAGRCYAHLKSYANAEVHCARAASLLASNPRGQICLGKAQFNSKKYEAAAESFLNAYRMTKDTLYRGESRSGVLASLARLNKLDSAPSLLGLSFGELSLGQDISKVAENAALTIERGERWRY